MLEWVFVCGMLMEDSVTQSSQANAKCEISEILIHFYPTLN